MTAKFFVDTNVLAYAASNAVADRLKRDLALDLLDRSDLALSAQVLAEFYAVATSKAKLNLTATQPHLSLIAVSAVRAPPPIGRSPRGRAAPSGG
jgi:predicted nucleic acid-binding protein